MGTLTPVQQATLVVVAAGMAVALYYCFRPDALLSRRIDLVCSRMMLRRAKATDSIWDAQRKIGNQFGAVKIGAAPVAQGERGGIPVQVQFYPKVGDEYAQEAATSVLLVWPHPVSEGVEFDRVATLGEPTTLMKRFPILGQSLVTSPFRRIDRPWYGPVQVHGSDAELERIFSPQMKALLDTFPRRLAIVRFVDKALTIEWFGLEDDLTVIEQAFRLGVKCLELVAPRT